MTKPHALQIHDLNFHTQTQAIAWFKTLLAQSLDGQQIDNPNHDRLIDLLKRHPDASQKIGCGVAYFFGAPAKEGGYSTRCFHLVRLDHSVTDFSYRTCIRGKPHSLFEDFRDAARVAVQARLLDWKRTWFNNQSSEIVRCPETGRIITFETAHVDHRPPWTFDRICREFLKDRNLVPNYAWISLPTDNQYRAEIVESSIKEAFVAYHDKKAELQVLSATQNLRHGSKRSRSLE